MDLADITQEQLDLEIELQRKKIKPMKPVNALHCKICGDDIYPPERRDLGYDSCIDCAQLKDRMNK